MSDTLDLCGQWLIKADPRDEGLTQRWWETTGEGWLTTTVPSACQFALGADYKGVAWYRKSVDFPAAWPGKDGRVWLRFDAVATDCLVWVNGREVGRHVGDYLPFHFEITKAVGDTQRLEIVARVDMIPAALPPKGVLTQNGHLTKGFHDILSLQHGGIWDRVTLRRTGPFAIVADGVRVDADAVTGRVIVWVQLEPHDRTGRVTVEAEVPGYPGGTEYVAYFAKGQREVMVECTDAAAASSHDWQPQLWSPESPALGEVMVTVHPDVWNPSWREDTATVRFGFRDITTGGPDNRTILLNGHPLLLCGVLHWGHEPAHIAPAPPPDQVREEFTRLRGLGFNCVCLCMWYPPEYYYDIADETGMLLWQEHPVWKSPMGEEHIDEYKRLFEGFFRRDRNHPSVILVSGSCEHESFHPELAAWWWERARQELPHTLRQVQTAFLAWTNPDQTDLHDEHVYESSGRWVAYMQDLQDALGELPPKPFIMGETIIGTAWGDIPALLSFRTATVRERTESPELRPAAPQLGPPESPWWIPRGLDACAALEQRIAARYGDAALARFRTQSDRQHHQIRKFQTEVFRAHPNHAGWVMNHIRDVPVCRCGFKDDREVWRYAPDETLPWLGERAILLATPDHRRGFLAGERIDARIGLSNFAAAPFDGNITLRVEHHTEPSLDLPPLRCDPGDVRVLTTTIHLPTCDGDEPSPVPLHLHASAEGARDNRWTLWSFPAVGDAPPDVVRLDGLPFAARELEPEFEERAYSSGWGLKAQRWKPLLPDLSQLLFKAPLWRFDAPMPAGTRVVVAHRLTERLVGFMESGGRVVLLASKAAGGPRTIYTVTWGQCPLIIEEGPIRRGESEWLADLLHHDLTRRVVRAIPAQELGIADQVDPLVRMVHTHDLGVPKLLDALVQARVGRGLLIMSTLDHSEAPGQYLLHRTIRYAAGDDLDARSSLDPAMVRSWTLEGSGAAGEHRPPFEPNHSEPRP